MPMDPAIPISLSIGFALRVFLLAFDRRTIVRPLFVGIWEGIALYRGLSSSDSQLNAYLACALRLLFDFCFTENMHTMMAILFSLVLAVLFSDALGLDHGHDIRMDGRSRPSGIRRTAVYQVPEVADSHRLNRARLTPAMQTGVRTWNGGIIVHVPQVNVDALLHDDSPSPRPIQTGSTHLPATLNPLTPPCTPPEPGPSRFCGALNIPSSPDSESRQDELPTPASSAVPQSLSLRPNFDSIAIQPKDIVGDHGEEDELQTPLAVDLRNLPVDDDLLAAEEGQLEDGGGPLLSEDIPFLDDSASLLEAAVELPGADEDNLSELSLKTGTELSIISAVDAQSITAKAERLRKEAWKERDEKIRLERKLNQAVSQQKIKDAFLLRREIEAAEERVQKLHRRAARRHFRARNLYSRDSVIDVHGLFVPEAIKKVETSLQAAILNGAKDLQVIVGRGLHSHDGRPKLRPAIIMEMQKQSIACQIHPHNPGVLILTVPS
ncbi:hypothetical protein DFH07DRAFT_853742 [Mycena maculata]|uniref:Smr domain-containing protein n=1 Tax=Mycena maculata TaxID=230809 RepID=A0AAD7MNM4_9AGAR|nr:hypothetical protein DFH07DRAFT_853742 [Mycena maculata]